MTEQTVDISITIEVNQQKIQMAKKVDMPQIEESVHNLMNELGGCVIKAGIEAIDDQIAKEKPTGWRNAGTEARWLVSSLGAIRYKRRIYVDEHKRRRKPVDEILGVERYMRASERVQEMGAYLACTGTYRRAAAQLSWMIKTPISHSAIQRMCWEIGNRMADGEDIQRRQIFEAGMAAQAGQIKAPVIFAESDGVWLHLQREARKSAEVRVAIMSSGKRQIGKNRYKLEHKCCVTAIGERSDGWQEHVLQAAHRHFDLQFTKLLISGGDGSRWVRRSFSRFALPQEFILDHFHLKRAARRAIADGSQADRLVKVIRAQGFCAVRDTLDMLIAQSEGHRRELLVGFCKYIQHNQDGLLDLQHRGYSLPSCLGAIEGNVDKLVVQRMKGRGCSWRLPGVRAMLALCANREALMSHAYHYTPISLPRTSYRRVQSIHQDYADVIQRSMPVFSGPDQNKSWVVSLRRYIHGR